MFGNGNGVQQNSEEMTIYMGTNMELKGTLTFEGTGRIDGKVEGKIMAKGVIVIGEGAMVSSELEGDTVVVGGNVEGKIVGRRKVQLLKTAVVNADITTPTFLIEEGCRFNGSCRMSVGAEAAPAVDDAERDAMRFAATATK
ncbi:MAG: polymer-forming cytoskeletal protein [Nitrospirae bacterium]|nr:polymer-forming cytoskeletal protein [Nitrospirota bacterium]